MNLQVAVLDVQRQVQAFALDRAGEGCCDVQVQGVSEFVLTRGAAGFDSGGHIAGVMASEAGFAERSEEIAQSFITEKVQTLVSDFKSRLLLGADLPASARTFRGIVRLINADVVFLLHALDEL